MIGGAKSITPFFQTAHNDDQKRRRLLVISYHFPPDRVIGARRWEKLARYAAERGYGMDVIMCRGADEPMTDLARLQALPSGVRIFGVPQPELGIQRIEHLAWSLLRGKAKRDASVAQGSSNAAMNGSATQSAPLPPVAAVASRPDSYARHEVRWSLESPRGYLRMYWAWLDFAHIRAWGNKVVQCASAIAGDGGHVAVVSSGPPHMSHDVGRRVSQRLGIPFVMDMRDPWRLAERLPEGSATPFWVHLADRYESRAVRRASLIVANTEVACRALQATYPDRACDIVTVMNGADDDPLPASRRGRRFVVAHAGTVYLDRDPRGLFQAAGRVIRELRLTPDDFGLTFMGEMAAVGGFPVADVAKQEGIEAYVTLEPPQPHAKAMEFMAGATMLVTMSGGNLAAIPAKTFECIRFESWVLALSAPGSATELLLDKSGADVVAPSDVDAIEAAIRTRYLAYRRGELPPRIGDNPRFSRQGQAKVLFDAIEDRLLSRK